MLLAAFSYGASRIQIPFIPAAVIAGMGTTVLGLPLAAALAPAAAAARPGQVGGVSLLLFIGLWNPVPKQHQGFLKRLGGGTKLLPLGGGVGFVLDVYMDETLADADPLPGADRPVPLSGRSFSLDSPGQRFWRRAGPAASGNFVVEVHFSSTLAAVGERVRLWEEALAHRQELNISWLGAPCWILLALLWLA